ncbi:hypothetical protein KO528_14890 [Saccharophagus degradans]|uniref:hypothetical protein n=1 Tax=Saccharophagus degradans TaxID=86304 RepID=UPI001C08974D|nr:hypothetical protein [Saccharophagus degradans]MBU2986648.1 hypothetical protein [Saccharophagus degradans]
MVRLIFFFNCYLDPNGHFKENVFERIKFEKVGTGNTERNGLSTTFAVGNVTTDSGSTVRAYKNMGSEKGFDTNCHGTTFAKGQLWLNPAEVSETLKGEGFQEIDKSDAKVGDVVVYSETDPEGGDRMRTLRGLHR